MPSLNRETSGVVAPKDWAMARRGATETSPRPASSAPALDLKNTYRREMHLAFCPSQQVIEVANIFSALRAHHKPTLSAELANGRTANWLALFRQKESLLRLQCGLDDVFVGMDVADTVSGSVGI